MICYLFQICKGDPPIPRWLSPGARTMVKRMLDPNPVTRITVVGIKASEWFKHEYIPSIPDDDDEEEVDTDDDAFSIQELVRICRLMLYCNCI